jgi:hypothetical protein
MTPLHTARIVGAYADILRQWAGTVDSAVIGIAAPRPSILRDTAIECATAADAVAAYLKKPLAERRRRAPLRGVLRQLNQAHHRFVSELSVAVRLAAKSRP